MMRAVTAPNPTANPVLIATDLTEASDVALVRGHAHAQAIGAPFVVCHVVADVLRHHPLFPQRNEADVLKAAEVVRRAAELVTEHVGRVLRVGADAYTVEIETGNAEDEIVRVAEEQKASMVVIGGKPREGVEKVLGHVAERVVRYAHVPVLVARPGHHTRKILVATDFSDGSKPALELAKSIMATGVEGTLLHVMQRPSTFLVDVAGPFGSPWMPVPKSAIDELESLGKKTLESIAKQYGFANSVQLEGEPAEVIAERAHFLDVEMILMGSRGRTGLARLVLGSTAEKVIRASECSVLVTRS
jgi:nucleotide-binding universal stress UspA family protein